MIIRLMKADFSENNIGVLDKWYIKNQTSGMTLTLSASSIDKDDTTTAITGTLTVESGYTLTEAVKITMGDVDKTSWYDSSTGAIAIPAGSITNDVYITGKAISESGEEEPDEPTDTEIDISSLFTPTFAAGAIYADPSNANFGGTHSSQTAYYANASNSAYVNIADYAGKTLKITLPYATQSSHTVYGIAFYTAAGKSNAISDVENTTIQYIDGSTGAETREIVIPSTAKLARTTWLTPENETACGVAFSAKIING